MTSNAFWDKTWLFIRLGLVRRTQEYGTKAFYISWVILTFVLFYLVVSVKPVEDFEIASTACQSNELIVKYDNILVLQKDAYFRKLVYFCKETK